MALGRPGARGLYREKRNFIDLKKQKQSNKESPQRFHFSWNRGDYGRCLEMFVEVNQTRPRTRDFRVVRSSPPFVIEDTKSLDSSWSSIPCALLFSILIFF